MSYLTEKAAGLLAEAGITLGGSAPGDFTILNSALYRKGLLKGSLGLGESYMDGDWESEHLDITCEKLIRSFAENDTAALGRKLNAARNFFFNLQSKARAFIVGQEHYDLGNSFYELLLGESMGYSAGIYASAETTGTEAQYAKFKRVAELAKLGPGKKVLEIGAGWGAFAKVAAQDYGATVVGLSVSKEQTAFAHTATKDLPVSYILQDYRTLGTEHTAQYDNVVSIEMIEAVGPKNMRTYFETAHRALKSDGTFVLQAIMGDGASGGVDAWIEKYIFPNGALPYWELVGQATSGLFTIEHVHSFGHDYARTLHDWDKNFKKHWPTISGMKSVSGQPFDNRFYRMWRYYLMCCAAAFQSGQITVSHIVLKKI
jgi:cyclopropane-fatty-acyl-phospholipid synthase